MGKCLTFYVNMTVPDPGTSNYTLHLAGPGVQDFDGNVTAYDDQGKAKIFQTGPHSVTIIYSGVFNGVKGNMLLIYRQEGKHLDAEELKDAQVGHQKTAECLNFTVPSTFKYDGIAEFCRGKKKEEKAEA
ncbi:saxitoxin and tetrodotoxin-binding protein 1-like [Halichoeres trimaculatus]|uniref:saxitoxin and tetrodotoxin-binding protein 1-like n=1 Tax=Halichoeres trimaculatus TaxID=147232 RepID=UPI003D9E22A2